LKIAHAYQESGIRLHVPQAAQLHIYHTMHGLQQAGHAVSLLALQEGRRVIFTDDLQVFKTDALRPSHFARLGLSGTRPFRLFESGVRRVQTGLHLPYLALFDSYRLAEAGVKNLKGLDLIHERFNLLALGGAFASKRLGLPLVLEVNADLLQQRQFKGVPETGLRRWFAVWATRLCFSTAARIICISAGLKDHLHRRWHIPTDKLSVLPCAADVTAFAPNGSAPHVRQALGLTTEPVVMWVGGFYPWHDLDILLNGFGQVLQQHPNARLVLVGEGQTRPMVTQKVMQAGLGNAVIFTGAIAHARVPEYLSVADVAVVPAAPVPASRGGTGTPLKLFEYMAAGKAIVATALDQAAEVIQDGQNGLLVGAGDVNGFAVALQRLLGDAAERERLGHNARQRALAQHTWQHYTQALEGIYRQVLGDGRGQAASA
jgi:glycosyltransferase involved in cell wall biosynthesis